MKEFFLGKYDTDDLKSEDFHIEFENLLTAKVVNEEEKNLPKQPNEIMLYDKKLTVETSSRRWKTTGYWKTMYIYIINYVWVKVFNKNYH